MAAGVVIDTSFLITLAGKNRKNHDAARRYWRHFLDNEIPVFLSTVVVSEFCIKQAIDPEILRCCVVLPFNWDDALRAAQLDWTRARPPDVPRDALKDDIKIIAQAAVAEAEFVITDDTESFYRYCEAFKEAGAVQFKAIKLADGFDRAFFDANGQRDFTDTLNDEEDYSGAHP
jgi:hypothetical protein